MRPCVTSLLSWEYLQPAFGCSVQTGVPSNKANRVRVPHLYAANPRVKGKVGAGPARRGFPRRPSLGASFD